MIRYATAFWTGSGKEGNGNITTESGVMNEVHYAYTSRFENASGTNPEELVAAAHAGCFTMKLSFVLGEMGHTATSLNTKCEIDFQNGEIVSSHLTVQASVPGLNKDDFDKAITDAKENCPISKLYNTKITADASLS